MVNRHTLSRNKRRSAKTRKQRGGQGFKVFYGSTEVDGQQLTKEETDVKPSVTILPNHYIVMYDPDAIKPDYIHWIAGPQGDILPYRGPSPPQGTGVHRYIFLLAKGVAPSVPLRRNSQKGKALAKSVLGLSFFTVKS
jgi:hypothetical protein